MLANLRVHTEYSLLESSLRLEDYVRKAVESGFSALAITDSNNTYGAIKFHDLCIKKGIKPIIGVTLYTEKKEPIVLLAKDQTGYYQLCSLITRKNSDPSHFNLMQSIIANVDSCFIITASVGVARFLRPFFHSSLFLQVDVSQQHYEEDVFRARAEGIPFIPVWVARYSEAEDFETLKVLCSIKLNRSIWECESDVEQFKNARFPTLREFREKTEKWPEAERSIHCIVEQCNVTFRYDTIELPSKPYVKKPSVSNTSFRHLVSLCFRSLNRKFAFPAAEYKERLNKELHVIKRLGLEEYFLIVDGITRFARMKKIFYTGRGSAANSLVCFLLEITLVDPVRNNLFFERFLHLKRKGLPDIDMDFPWDRRDEVIRHIYDTYTTERTALIGTHVRFNLRSAIRETARVFGISQADISLITKRIPWHVRIRPFYSLLEERPEFKDLQMDGQMLLLWRRIFTRAEKIAGLVRHISIHPGGMVIAPRSLSHFTGLDLTPAGYMVTQLDMYDIEKLGLMKMDILGQRSLAVIGSVVQSLRLEMKITDDLSCYQDEKTVSCISKGESIGCFYIESPAMRQLLKKLRVRTFADLTAASSVIRPGVAESGMMQKYIEYTRHPERVRYLCPELKDVLSETFGIMIYQEDVLRVSTEIAGLPPEEADILRKAMSGKGRSHEAIRNLGVKFREGCRNRNMDESVVQKLWEQTESFAGYAFCKAHSASFARLSFMTAYLKTHHPGPFMASVISNRGGFYPSYLYVEEARRLGLKILPPDVNFAGLDFQGDRTSIRAGFSFIKGLRQATMEKILHERESGPFQHLAEFLERCEITVSELDILAGSGALDGFGLNRRQVLNVGRYMIKGGKNKGPLLFLKEKKASIPQLPDLNIREKVFSELQTMGMGITASPAVLLNRRKGDIDSRKLNEHNGHVVSLPGVRIFTKPVLGKNSTDLMEFVSFMDEYGTFEGFLAANKYAKCVSIFQKEHFVSIRGRIREDYDTFTIDIESCKV